MLDWTDDDLEALSVELKTQSDRGAALVGMAALEDLLQEALAANMRPLPPKETERLFTGSGPLATMSSRIAIAYAFDIINDWRRNDLIVLSRIRNKFAHSPRPLSFADIGIADQCRALHARKYHSDPTSDARSLYLKTISVLMMFLVAAARRPEHPAASPVP